MADLGKTQEWRVLKERVEILYGLRGDKQLAAMRVGEAKDLREFIANLRKGTADVQKELNAAQEMLETLQIAIENAEEALLALADDTDGLLEFKDNFSVFGQGLGAAEDAPAARLLLGLGSAATATIGTSGANVPLLNGGNTWSNTQTIQANLRVNRVGQALEGVFLMDTDPGQRGRLYLRTAGVNRWIIESNTADDFQISRHNDSGTLIANAVAIARATGKITVGGTVSPGTADTFYLGSDTERYAGIYTVRLLFSATVFDSAGAGSPEGVIAAGVGSTYRRTDGGAASSFYVKEGGGGGNTGWVAK